MEKPQEIITSKSNALLQLTASLSERKQREKKKLFRFDGKKLLFEAIDKGLPLEALLFRESTADRILREAGERKIPPNTRAVLLPDGLFQRLSEEKSPDGVIAVSKWLDKIHKIVTIEENSNELLSLSGNILFLESVRDPGNLGTVIRSACAFGAKALVMSADCVDLYNPRVIRGAMGALFRLPVYITREPAATLRLLQQRGKVYGAALDENATRLNAVTFGANDTVAVGNEGHGLSKELLSACEETVYIPMEKGVESLNAGVAASLLLWEFYRGR